MTAAAAAFALRSAGGFFARRSICLMSINFGEGTSASLHARSQVSFKGDFGLTHTFPHSACFTDGSAFFSVRPERDRLRGFMSGSPPGKKTVTGAAWRKIIVARAEPAPNIDNLTPWNAAGYDHCHTTSKFFSVRLELRNYKIFVMYIGLPAPSARLRMIWPLPISALMSCSKTSQY
ncbi:MAG: hypothetical protein ACXVK3_11475, partial [Candidatus Angelobacter sp.]